MQTIPSITTVVNSNSLSLSPKIKNLNRQHNFSPSKAAHYGIPNSVLSSSAPTTSVLCRATQLAELFPTTSPEVVVREARIDECWEVAETHCSSFFPQYSFPLDFVLRLNRFIGMFSGFSLPKGCKKACLVAVIGSSGENSFFLGSWNKGFVAGILTVDTVANFLPRKGPLRQRRKGIAYISNVAVREKFRRKGIAKRLIAKAEAKAQSWGCRAIALHCDLNEPGPAKLYLGLGFKPIKVPEGANWPRPKHSANVNFCFMMKLLRSPND